MRAKTFNIRFSEEELGRLDKVAEHYALTAAGVIRMLVKREADEIDAKRAAIAAAAAPSRPARKKTAK
ncbi:hypothetical protein [Labilithrix luteola]|uniref:hypothetical protein n=1 Tax=Labilithrix luteola TaxID=1391654 RepID=UPI0011BA584B|nr:hypothetical protein [Labilithrix luteola]